MEKITQNSTLEKVPPNDLETEEQVLGCLILYPANLSKAMEILGKIGKEAFYNESTAKIYNALIDMAEKNIPIEEGTLLSFIKENVKEKTPGSYLADLVNKAISEVALEYQLKRLKELSSKRQLINISIKGFEAVSNGATVEEIKYNQIESLSKIETEDKQRGMSAWDSLNTSLVETPSPVEGLLVPERYAIMAAWDGEGKTTFLLQLSLCAATGTPFLGRFRIPKPVKVLYFCGENSRHDINKKLRKQISVLERLLGREIKEELKMNLTLVYPEEIDFLLDKAQDRPIIDAYLKKYRPAIVIFDPLSDFISTERSLNDDTIARQTGKALNKLAREYNCCPILVTHFKKKGEDDDETKNERDTQFIFGQFHGSKYWTNIAVTQIAMIRWNPQKFPTAKIVYFKNKTVTEISPMLLLRDRETLWYEETSRDEFSKAKLLPEDVVNVLREIGGKQIPSIVEEEGARKLECSKRQIRGLVKLAKEQGLIKKEGTLLRIVEFSKHKQQDLIPPK